MIKRLFSILIFLTVAACSSTGWEDRRSDSPPSAGGVKIGKPYQIGGVWYHPEEDPTYDRTGHASWYGPNFHGKRTANGEIFDMNKLSAAHTTLPMPSFVRVTNLENGRSLKLRINDRGPFAKNRIIDVSRRAAQLLGFEKKGVTRVRVQAVNPDGSLIKAPPRQRQTVETAPASSVGAPPPATSNRGNLHFVQIGAFSSQEGVDKLRPHIQGLGPIYVTPVRTSGRTIYRLRVGPYTSRREAERIIRELFGRGIRDARIVRDVS